MPSPFLGLEIAKSGVFAARRALHVVSHNLSNVNTPGYSRQRSDTHASIPLRLPYGQGSLGTGVMTSETIQIRSEFLDSRVRKESTVHGEWEARELILKMVEDCYNEPNGNGITATINQFFESVNKLNANNASSLTVRALIRQNAIAMVQSFGMVQNSLIKLQDDTEFKIKATVSQINAYAEEIRTLNENIYQQELDKTTANDLRDQRNLALDNLSKLVNINAFEDEFGKYHVQVNGHHIVNHIFSDKLIYNDRVSLKNPYDSIHLTDLKWASDSTFRPTGGSIKGYMDMRDSDSAERKGIPFYLEELNKFTDRFISELNRVHMGGFDLNGNTNTMLFTMGDMSTVEYETYIKAVGFNGGLPIEVTSDVLKGTDAKLDAQKNYNIIANNIKDILDNNPQYKDKAIKMMTDKKYYIVDRIPAHKLTLSRDFDLDLNKFAAADKLAGGIPGGSDNALHLANVRYNQNMFAYGSPDDYVRTMIPNLGVDANEASKITKDHAELLKDLENKRQSIMGVSEDEEIADMVKFQHWFSANARMMTTMDELLDIVINRMGLVGR